MQIFEQLFATKISTISIDNLESTLQLVSKELKKTIAFVVIAKDNNDFYFDIDSLFDRERLKIFTSSSGVTKEYIEAFKILHTTVLPKRIKDSVSEFNYENSTEVYVLWTNDMINFKVREQSVSRNLTDKLLHGSPSDIINSRSQKFEELLFKNINDDVLTSFKQIKYLSFEIDNEERVFIDNLCKQISEYIKKYFKSPDDKIITPTFTEDIGMIFQNEFKSFKPFHSAKHMPLQPLLIYTSTSIQLTNRIKKDIANWIGQHGSIEDIDSIIQIAVDSNDNIYTKFISSYYLAMSAFK